MQGGPWEAGERGNCDVEFDYLRISGIDGGINRQLFETTGCGFFAPIDFVLAPR